MKFRAKHIPAIPQDLLVVRGARHNSEVIRELLHSPVPRPPEMTQKSTPSEQVYEESLRFEGTAKLRPEPTNVNDIHAIEVLVENKRVGYIAATKAPRLGKIIGTGVELDCTIFWNGDPNADFQFFTVQLFAPNRRAQRQSRVTRY